MKVHSTAQVTQSAKFQEKLQTWEASTKKLGHVVGSVERDGLGLFDFAFATRQPLQEGCHSEARDGAKVAPLMGLSSWDDGMTLVRFNPFSSVLISNDHAVLLSFIPRSASASLVRIWWLVDGAAKPGVDFDPESVKWMWRVTTEQDVSITENNQAGIRSRSYSPGIYSEVEQDLVRFVKWYLVQISAH